jgi:hypothetical protein
MTELVFPIVGALLGARGVYALAYTALAPVRFNKIGHIIWDMAMNVVLLSNIARIACKDPSVLDMSDPTHFVQTERIADIDQHYIFEMAWYTSATLNMFLFPDCSINALMILHHAASLTLIVLSYSYNLTYFGFVLLSLLIGTNPLLHMSKVLVILKSPLAKPTFMLFALMFFVTRVVLFPTWFMRITLWDLHPYWKNDRFELYVASNVFLGVLFALQLVWFQRVIRFVAGASNPQ